MTGQELINWIKDNNVVIGGVISVNQGQNTFVRYDIESHVKENSNVTREISI